MNNEDFWSLHGLDVESGKYYWIRGELYPVTIIRVRYSGIYEGGVEWVAFNDDMDDVLDATGSDIDCVIFFDEYEKSKFIGRGNSPEEAYQDLRTKVLEITNTRNTRDTRYGD